MSENALTIPDSSEEENRIVGRFIEESREIAPSVEVTLAKRITRPGSNRVICLAARTSMPLDDNQLNSVSDLALRLSDGTNVALSLSFFTDNSSNEFIPFGRSFNRYGYASGGYTTDRYEPYRYVFQDDSKLPVVLMATALAALVGFYAAANGGAHLPWSQSLFQAQSSAQTMAKTAAPAGVAAAKVASALHPQSQVIKPAMTKTAADWSTADSIEANKAAASTAKKATHKHHTHEANWSGLGAGLGYGGSGSRSAASEGYESGPSTGHSKRSAMLVPPPPPMEYNLPSQFPPGVQIMESQFPMMMQPAAVQVAKTAKKVAPIFELPAAASALTPGTRPAEARKQPADVPPARSAGSTMTAARSTDAGPAIHILPAASAATETQAGVSPVSSANQSSEETAPMPGTLERIVAPEHD